jgi:hypothetical protein
MDRTSDPNTGVVMHEVNSADLFERTIAKRLDGGRIGDIGDDRNNVRPVARYRSRRLVQRALSPRGSC